MIYTPEQFAQAVDECAAEVERMLKNPEEPKPEKVSKLKRFCKIFV